MTATDSISVLGMNFDKTHEHLYVFDSSLQDNVLASLSYYEAYTLVALLLGSFLIGSYFKFALYHYMYISGSELKKRPINVLLLIWTAIQHIICFIMVTNYCAGLLFDIALADYFGEAFCNFPLLVGVFGAGIRTTGSFGIALYRVLLVRHDRWAKYKVGLGNLAAIIFIVTLCTNTGLTAMWGLGSGQQSRKQVNWNFCTGKSYTFRETVHSYRFDLGEVTHGTDLPTQLALVAVMTLQLAELWCYVALFYHVYVHDQNAMRKKLVGEAELTKRHRKNAITFLGMFYGFLVEMLFYIVLFVCLGIQGSSPAIRALAIMLYWIEFGVSAVVEVYTSHDLEDHLPHKVIWN